MLRKKLANTLVLATVAALAAGAFVIGCVDNDKSFVIVFAVPPVLEGDTCTVTLQDAADAEFQSTGTLDLDFPLFNGQPTYGISLQAENRLINNADSHSQRINSQDILLEKIEVTFEWLQGQEQVVNDVTLGGLEDQKVTVPVSATIGAAEDFNKPGQLLLSTNVIPPEIGLRLMNLSSAGIYDQVVLGVIIQMVGTTTGGSRTISNKFTFPLYFCSGCHGCFPGYVYKACRPGQDRYECEEAEPP